MTNDYIVVIVNLLQKENNVHEVIAFILIRMIDPCLLNLFIITLKVTVSHNWLQNNA